MTTLPEVLADRVQTASNFIIQSGRIWPWFADKLKLLHFKWADGRCDICGTTSRAYEKDKYKLIFESYNLNWSVIICSNTDVCKYIQAVQHENN